MASFSGVQPQSSGLYLDFMTAEENEFLAKETLVTITSRVNQAEFQFISGTFGPLEAGLPCNVPLWFALQLHRSGKCDIKMPDWLSVESLQETLDIEKESAQFSNLPFHYIEIAQLLLSDAKDDFESPDHVRNLLQDIENVRMDRIRSGIDDIGEMSDGKGDWKVGLKYIAAMEILAIKGFLQQSFNMFRVLNETSAEKGAEGDDGPGVGLGNRNIRRGFRLDT